MAIGGEMEESFPRGKKRVYDDDVAGQKKVAKQPVQKETFDNLDDLFAEKPDEKVKINSDGTKKKKKKGVIDGVVTKKAPKATVKKEQEKKKKKTFKADEEEGVRGKPEKYDYHVLPGTLLLGIVMEVEPYLLNVSLPGGVTGIIPINEVSVAYTQLLKSWTDSESLTPEEEIFTLEKMFAKGQVLRVKVLSTDLGKDEDTPLKLTVNPREVNVEITPGRLVEGLTLSGCVSSVEDHGFKIDIGVSGIIAFAKSNVQDESEYRVGSYVEVVVKTSSPDSLRSGESRHVGVQILRENKAILPFGTKRDFSSLMPGQRIKGKITRTTKEGIGVSICDGTITAHAHFTLLRQSPKKYEESVISESHVGFVVVGVNSATKIIQLSDLPHLMRERKVASPVEERFQVDEMLKMSVEWVLSRSSHVVFKSSVGDKDGGEAGDEITRALYNKSVKNPVKFASSKRSAVSCQVIGFALVENALVVNMKSEKATEFIAKLKGLPVGTVVKGVVKSYSAKGAVIQVNEPTTVLANVDWRRMDNEKIDDFNEVKTLHPVNSAISGRVLTVDVKTGGVSATCQPALVESSLPILNSLEDAVINRVYAGSICHLFENSDSALVKFYNGVTGILFLKQALYPIDLFFVGCPVLVKVTKIDLATKKLVLHLEKFHLSYVKKPMILSGPEEIVANEKDADATEEMLGSVVRSVVVRHSPRGALVRLPSGRLSILQRTHLSDFPEFFALLSSSLSIGAELPVVVLNGEMVSAKRELIAYAEDHSSPTLWQKAIKEPDQPIIESGGIYPLTVIDRKDFGFYAVLYNGCHAFVPNKLMTSTAPDKSSSKSTGDEAKSGEDKDAGNEAAVAKEEAAVVASAPPSNLFAVGQTLFGNVKLVEEEKRGNEVGNRIVVNTKAKYCDPGSLAKTRTIFANYLEEKLTLGCGRGTEKIGTVLSVQVLETRPEWVRCTNGLIVEGAVNCPTPVSVGDTVQATVIDYEPVGDTLYGSFIPVIKGHGLCGDSDSPAAEEVFLSVVLRVAAPRYVVVYRSSPSTAAVTETATPSSDEATEAEKSEESADKPKEDSQGDGAGKSTPNLFFVAAQKFYNDLDSSIHLRIGQTLQVRFQKSLPAPFCLPNAFFRSRGEGKKESKKVEKKPTPVANTGSVIVDQMLAADMEMFYRVNPLELIELKQGSVIDAVVSSLEPTFIKVLINDRFPGRICRSEVGDPITGAKPPKIKVGHHVKVRVVGVSISTKKEEEPIPLGVTKPAKEVEISEKERDFIDSFVIECSARRDIVHGTFMASLHLSPPPLVRGRSVLGFVFGVDVEAKEVLFKITHFAYATVPFASASKDPVALLKNPEKAFPLGHSMRIVIERKLNGYCYSAAVPGVVSSAVPRLKAFTHTTGEITKVTPLWAHLTLVGGAEARIHISDARDMYSRDPMSLMFYEGQIVKCYVKACPTDEIPFYALSTRKTRMKNTFNAKDPEIKSVEDMLPGSLIGGFVDDEQGLGGGGGGDGDDDVPLELVKIVVSPFLSLTVKKEHLPFDLTPKMMYPGKWVRVRILHNPFLEQQMEMEEDGSVEKFVSGSLKSEDTGVGELYLKQDELSTVNVSGEREKRKRTETTGSEAEISSPKKKRKQDGEKKNKKKKRKKGIDKPADAKASAEEKVGEEGEEEEKEKDTRLSLDNFSWDFDGLMAESTSLEQRASIAEDVGEDDDDDDDVNEDAVTEADATKPAAKSQKSSTPAGGKGSHSQMMAEETAISAKEKSLSSDATPTSAEDFERLLVASPDSSIVWIHYMSFRLQEAEVEEARLVAKRALETINYREEGEKINVWVALLNLEMNYGTEEQLLETFSRASRENDELTIKRHMAVIYAQAGKHQLAEKMYLGLIKKFPEEIPVWTALFTLYFEQQKKEPARRLLERALQSLASKFHIPILTKVACLEFKSGDKERGRDVFERILSNFPKRLDVWTLYVDQLTAAADIEGARGVLNRAATLSLGAAKMRTIFKKFLAFEKTHGSEEEVEAVKTMAAQFVEKKRNEMQSSSKADDDGDEDS